MTHQRVPLGDKAASAIRALPSWAFVLAAMVPLLLARVAWGVGGMSANVGLLELSNVSEGATRIGIMAALVWARQADPWVNAAEIYVAYGAAQLGAVFYLATLAGIPQTVATEMTTTRLSAFAIGAIGGIPLLAGMIFVARRFAGVSGGVYLGRGAGRGGLTMRERR